MTPSPARLHDAKTKARALRRALEGIVLCDRDTADVFWLPTGGPARAEVALAPTARTTGHGHLARAHRAYGQKDALNALAAACDAIARPLLSPYHARPPHHTTPSVGWCFTWGGSTPVRWAATLHHGDGLRATSHHNAHPDSCTLERTATLMALMEGPLVLWSTPVGGVVAPSDPVLALLVAEATGNSAGRTVEAAGVRLRAWAREQVWECPGRYHQALDRGTEEQAEDLLRAIWPDAPGLGS